MEAQEALRIGLVNRVVGNAQLQEETLELAREIAANPRVALGYIKKNLIAAETSDFPTACALGAFRRKITKKRYWHITKRDDLFLRAVDLGELLSSRTEG